MSERCEYYEEQISAFLDGALTQAETEELQAHLETCPQCRGLMDAFTGLSDILRSGAAEAPAALADGVMSRIYAWEEEHPAAGSRPVDIRAARRTRRRWTGLATAACLVVVIGVGAYFGAGLLAPKSAAGTAESVTLEAVMDAPAEAPVPLPQEESPILNGAAQQAADADVPEEAAEQAPPAEYAPAVEEYRADAAADRADTADEAALPEDSYRWEDAGESLPEPVEAEEAETLEWAAAEEELMLDASPMEAPQRTAYTWEAPAYVPEGREADFQELIQAASPPEDMDTGDLTLLAAVEYNGVIYEFLTDGGGHLLWRDAAESVDPILSPGAAEDLWDIIG